MHHASPPTTLDELEHRQDEVLARLDELNARIERLLVDHTGGQSPEGVPDASAAAAGPATLESASCAAPRID